MCIFMEWPTFQMKLYKKIGFVTQFAKIGTKIVAYALLQIIGNKIIQFMINFRKEIMYAVIDHASSGMAILFTHAEAETASGPG